VTFARPRASSSARGYGTEHNRHRKALLDQLQRDGIGTCCIGGEPIYPGQRLHLDHLPDRSGYRGLACARHNVRDGARRGRARQDASRLRW
jgi:hypothetical protein